MKQPKLLINHPVTSLLVIGFFCLLSVGAHAQALDSKGTDFWITFPLNFTGVPQLFLHISAEENTSGTVTIPGLGFNQPFTVNAGNVATVTLPSTAQLSQSNVISNNGIHITALKEVTVYAFNQQSGSTDAYLALPADILDTSYINLGYTIPNVANPSFSEFGIVATQNATTVTITPAAATAGHPAGIAYNLTLNQGQTYLLGSASGDLTGSIITATKPIAVFGGHQCAVIPVGSLTCDHIVEQLPPTSAWGRNFISVPLKSRRVGDTFRFLASQNGTTVRVNGIVVATLNRGQFYEKLLTGPSQITADYPILVAQYANSGVFEGTSADPFMMLITPTEQFLGNYTFVAPESSAAIHFVNVVAPADAIGSLKLDGVTIPSAQFTATGASGFYGAQLDLQPGVHTLNGTNAAFGIFVYGFGGNNNSYGYPGGQFVAPGTPATGLTLTPKTGTAAVGAEQCFEVTVRTSSNNPVANARVAFTIKGVNPVNSGFSTTNTIGIARFCYTGIKPGSDSVTASLGTLADAVSFTWTTAPNIYYSKPAGDLHSMAAWGTNPDGSGANPPDFGAGKTFVLSNRTVNYALTASWTVGGRLIIPAANALQINSNTLSIADLAGTGALSGTMNSNLIVNQPSGGNTTLRFLPEANNLNNLSIASNAATQLLSALSIYNVLTVQGGTFNTADLLTLKSNATNTARVAPVTGAISGSVTVERYIPARRAWRMLCAPVGGFQSINGAWQEGATTYSANPNPNPGYGTHITDGAEFAGYDHNPLNTSVSSPNIYSLMKYFSTSNRWISGILIGAPPSSALVNAEPYLLFVRGDRSFPLGLNTVPPTNTTLRATGPLKTGDQTFPVSAVNFTAISNPFASPINFATITRNNVQNNFYLWDPKLGGEFGVGGYVLLSYNGTSYDVIPAPVSPESQYIQSGQGFFVRSTGPAGSIVIKESDKSATPAADVFRVGGSERTGNETPSGEGRLSTSSTGLRINLQAVSGNNTPALLDEVFAAYGNNFSDKVDDLDAHKLDNLTENLAIIRDNQVLMVDRSQHLDETDVIRLKLWNTTAKTYFFEFNPVALNTAVSKAYLVDRYLKTTTPIDLHKGSQVYFSVNGDVASSDSSRFSVTFSADAQSSKESITTYPNPVSGKNIQLLFSNQPQGTYKIELVNSIGQTVHRAQIQHGGGSAIQRLQLTGKPASGVYMLNISNSTTKNTLKIVVNQAQ